MSSGVVSADFLFNVEKEYRILNELNYNNMLASENIWYPKVLRTRPMEAKSERLLWLLSTASIEQVSPADGGENGGNIDFDQLATITTEFFPAEHRRGFLINKMKYLNFVNGGIDPVAKWVADIGTYGAYYPQRLLAQAILMGGSIVGYDGVSYFNTAHPVHPLISGLGTYANDFTGAASGNYPGALPIDDSVTLPVAYTNLSKALSYITGKVMQPNGNGDPRMLEPLFILYPPRMTAQVAQLTDSDFIPQSGASGSASGDIRPGFKKFRMIEPVMVKEFDAGVSYTVPYSSTGGFTTVTGSDTTYYIVCREANTTELGAWVETKRMPFSLHTYTGESGSEGVDAVLGRSHTLEYHYDGWTSVNPGHMFTMFRFQGS